MNKLLMKATITIDLNILGLLVFFLKKESIKLWLDNLLSAFLRTISWGVFRSRKSALLFMRGQSSWSSPTICVDFFIVLQCKLYIPDVSGSLLPSLGFPTNVEVLLCDPCGWDVSSSCWVANKLHKYDMHEAAVSTRCWNQQRQNVVSSDQRLDISYAASLSYNKQHPPHWSCSAYPSSAAKVFQH
jgi:hypothetical protein